jgi:hypothetical protein
MWALGSASDTDFHLMYPNTENVAQYCTKEKEKMKKLLLDALF